MCDFLRFDNLHPCQASCGLHIIGTSGRHCSRSPLGGRLGTTLVDRYFHHYFLFCQAQLSLIELFGTSVVVEIGRRSGGRLATTLVDRYFHHSFLFLFFLVFFFSVVYFSHRRNARIQKLI